MCLLRNHRPGWAKDLPRPTVWAILGRRCWDTAAEDPYLTCEVRAVREAFDETMEHRKKRNAAEAVESSHLEIAKAWPRATNSAGICFQFSSPARSQVSDFLRPLNAIKGEALPSLISRVSIMGHLIYMHVDRTKGILLPEAKEVAKKTKTCPYSWVANTTVLMSNCNTYVYTLYIINVYIDIYNYI